jgi:glycosyltransferase involved in cell wall biosynthesis
MSLKILILCQNYPKISTPSSLRYIHTRNLELIKNHDIKVLNFDTKDNYIIDNIHVQIESSISDFQIKTFDKFILHAPNIKNHFRWLIKNRVNPKKVFFIFHGHEVLFSSMLYPKPYSFMPNKFFFTFLYDLLKFAILKVLFFFYLDSKFIFVSNWMHKKFKFYFPLIDLLVKKKNKLISYNSIDYSYETHFFDPFRPKKYDFVTIRSGYDGSKYAIDLVRELAFKFPYYKFLIIGKGKYFSFYSKPNNIDIINEELTPKEIIDILDITRIALMPSRLDSQGVMSCEIASTGMPLITSNIDSFEEIFNEFDNVKSVMNNSKEINLESLYKILCNRNFRKVNKYNYKNTTNKEISFITLQN